MKMTGQKLSCLNVLSIQSVHTKNTCKGMTGQSPAHFPSLQTHNTSYISVVVKTLVQVGDRGQIRASVCWIYCYSNSHNN